MDWEDDDDDAQQPYDWSAEYVDSIAGQRWNVEETQKELSRERYETHFQDVCSRLQRHDPTMTDLIVDPFKFPIDYGSNLGNALLNVGSSSINPHVRHVKLAGCLTSPDLDDVHRRVATEASALLSYVRQSASLRSFHYEAVEPLELWINAVADNGMIEELVLKPHELFPNQAMASLLYSTRSLKVLSIPVMGSDETLFTALAFNSTLETLELNDINIYTPFETAAALLSLQGHGTLSSLILRFYRDFSRVTTPLSIMQSLSALLRSTSILEYLAMTHCHTDADGLECLLEGLRCNRSITKLGFSDSDCLCGERVDVFVAFMQEMNMEERTGNSNLQTLQYEWTDGDDPDDEYSAFCWSLAEILKGPNGSGLVSLDIKAENSISFWHALADDVEHQSRNLSDLQLEHFIENDYEFAVALHHIPNLLYLRTLKWKTTLFLQVATSTGTSNLLDAFRKNGSLHKVVVTRGRENEPIWNAKEARLIEAFGERNQRLPELLGGNKAHEPESDHEHDRTEVDPTKLVHPALLLSAQQMPRMSVHHSLQGLLGMDQSVGPYSDPTAKSDATLERKFDEARNEVQELKVSCRQEREDHKVTQQLLADSTAQLARVEAELKAERNVNEQLHAEIASLHQQLRDRTDTQK